MLYDASGAQIPQSSLQFEISSIYHWGRLPNPREADLCNDGDQWTICHSVNPPSGDPWPWLAATYPCADGSTSLSKVVVVNRPDCQTESCWGTIDEYSLVFYNSAGEQDRAPIRISSVGTLLSEYVIEVPAGESRACLMPAAVI